MTEYVAIPDSDLEAGDGIKSEHALAFNNNVLAINEMDATALAAGAFPAGPWLIEDGAGGADPVYDFDTDGAVSSVTTPDFASGYDYQIVFEELSPSANGSVFIKWYRSELVSYTANYALASFGLVAAVYCKILIDAPARVVKKQIYDVNISSGFRIDENFHDALTFFEPKRVLISNTTASSTGHAVISVSAGTFDNGKIWLFKRKRQDY